MHAVDQDTPSDQVVYGDVNPGVLRNPDHGSGNLQLLATLRECEYLETGPRFILRIKCAFADLEFYGEFARGQKSRRVLIRVRCNARQRGISDDDCLAAPGAEKRWREDDQKVHQGFVNRKLRFHGRAIIPQIHAQ